MGTSLTRKLAIVALSVLTFSSCQTAKIDVAGNEDWKAEWDNPYYGADRRPANVDPGTLLKALLTTGSDAERTAAIKFMVEKGGVDFIPLEKAYRYAVRGGRLVNGQKTGGKLLEEDFKKFSELFESVDGKPAAISESAQSKFYVEVMSKEKQFISRIEGSTAFRAKAVESANFYRAKSLGKKNTVAIVKNGTENATSALQKAGVVETYDDLPDLKSVYADARRQGASPDQARRLVTATYSAFERTKTGTAKVMVNGVLKEVPVGGVSLIGKDTCKNLDPEGIETIARQAESFDEMVKDMPVNCLKDIKNLRQANAIVVINDNVKYLGRSPAAAHEVALAYADCNQGMRGIEQGAMSPSVVKSVAEAEKKGLKALPATALDCR